MRGNALDEAFTCGFEPRFGKKGARGGCCGYGTAERGAAAASGARLGEFEQRRSDAAVPKSIRNHQLFERGALPDRKLTSICYMYETGELTVNLRQIKVRPEVSHDLAKAAQGGTLWGGYRDTGGGQQVHYRHEVGSPPAPYVNAHIRHAGVLAQLRAEARRAICVHNFHRMQTFSLDSGAARNYDAALSWVKDEFAVE